MRWTTSRAVLAAGIAFLVTAGCEGEPPNAPALNTTEAEGVRGEVLLRTTTPAVTKEPAFTWRTGDPGIEWGGCPEWMPEGCELAVIQALDPQGLNADAFFKMEPGTTVPEHWHTSAERMVLLSGTMQVDYYEQNSVTFSPGTYAYGPARLPHETHCLGGEGDDPCILFIGFEEPVDAIEGQPEEIPGDPPAFTSTADDPGIEWGGCPEWMPEGCELAAIQALDPEGLNVDALFRLEPNSTVPMHWHTSAERMVLLSGEMRVNYQGQRPALLDPFTYAYGPAKLAHETRCGDGGPCILFIAFEEPVDAIDIRGGDLPQRP